MVKRRSGLASPFNYLITDTPQLKKTAKSQLCLPQACTVSEQFKNLNIDLNQLSLANIGNA
jgi:hypothetical protein